MSFPIPVFRKKAYPATYVIEQVNRIDVQGGVECAAFSTAYSLRHFGIEADGTELYKNFPSKTKTGTVYPKGIRTVLQQMGFQTTYYRGTIDTLKHEVSKGTPVITFIKVQPDKPHLHFVPVVGYDEHYMYLAESIERLANCEATFYNRKVPIQQFKKLWNTRTLFTPFYNQTYISITKNSH